jgi:hypothetical protein
MAGRMSKEYLQGVQQCRRRPGKSSCDREKLRWLAAAE